METCVCLHHNEAYRFKTICVKQICNADTMEGKRVDSNRTASSENGVHLIAIKNSIVVTRIWSLMTKAKLMMLYVTSADSHMFKKVGTTSHGRVPSNGLNVFFAQRENNLAYEEKQKVVD